jgi:hypothetical protein
MDQNDQYERKAKRVLAGALVVLTLGAVAATMLGGCIKAADGIIQCESAGDCDDGEVCGDDNLCYGNPPDLRLAVELYLPPGSSLARTDIPDSELVISENGDLELRFAPPVVVAGRVVFAADPGISVPATVVFRRASRIEGGPDVVVSTVAERGKLEGETAFSAIVSPTLPGETYEVTIYPTDEAQAQAPPKRISVELTADQPDVLFTLGDSPGLKQIVGRVVDAADRGVEGLVVRAYGRFLPTSKLELASSRGATDAEGAFAIWVPESWQNEFDLEIAPQSGATLPTILRRDVYAEDPPPGEFSIVVDIGDIAFPSFSDAQEFQLPVFGVSTGGGAEAAVGARVVFRSVLHDDEITVVSYQAEATVGEDGYATLWLIPGDLVEGNRVYEVDVVPAADSALGGVWDVPFEVGPQPGGVLGELATPLPNRVLVKGTIVDSAGVPVGGVSAQLVLSPFFTYGLEEDRRADATAMVWPAATTSDEGVFSLWIDPAVFAQGAIYDLELVPPDALYLPRWTVEQLAFPPATGMDDLDHDLGNIYLPDASLARGPVLDATGANVADAEVRVYAITDDGTLCANYGLLGDCVAPARLVAITESDGDGLVRLVLPRP